MAARSRFWDDLNRDLQDPEHRREFERESERIAQIDALINELDEIRELQGNIGDEDAEQRQLLCMALGKWSTEKNN